jgi:hypothetical protein
MIAGLVFASAPHEVLKGDLFAIRCPGVRKYCIFRNVLASTHDQAELAVTVQLQKTHYNDNWTEIAVRETIFGTTNSSSRVKMAEDMLNNTIVIWCTR